MASPYHLVAHLLEQHQGKQANHTLDRTDHGWSFQFYTFFEDLILWLPDFPLVVIMFDY